MKLGALLRWTFGWRRRRDQRRQVHRQQEQFGTQMANHRELHSERRQRDDSRRDWFVRSDPLGRRRGRFERG